MNPIDTRNVLRNIEIVLKTGDIAKLNGTAYRFLYLMQGFIAHYDLHGFQDYYSDVADLVRDIRQSADLTYAERYATDSFFVAKDTPYYRSKYETLVGLRELVAAYAAPARPADARTETPRQYRLFEDSGHAWLEVPRADVVASGADISAYSYYDEDTGMAYLEEDCDMPAFLRAIGCTLDDVMTETVRGHALHDLEPYMHDTPAPAKPERLTESRL